MREYPPTGSLLLADIRHNEQCESIIKYPQGLGALASRAVLPNQFPLEEKR